MSIRWGILGTANIADYGMIPGMKQAKDCELYAIAGRSEEKVKRYKEKFGFERAYIGYDALLADEGVQAVYIPLPNHLHYEWVMKAIQAGKHVLCEKPLALNAAEAEEMYRAAKEAGVVLGEAYAYLHSPYVEALKEDVKSGIIGELDYIESAFLTQGYEEDFRLYKEYGGGAMYDLGCYCTTMILSLVDSEVSFVKGCAEFNQTGADVNTAAILRFKNGVRASLNVGMLFGASANGRFDRLYIHGSKGYLKSDVEYNQAGELTYTVVSGGREIVRTVSAGQNYALEIERMNQVISGEKEQLVTPEFSIRNARLMDEVLREIGF